jgi:hypothetical protein
MFFKRSLDKKLFFNENGGGRKKTAVTVLVGVNLAKKIDSWS